MKTLIFALLLATSSLTFASTQASHREKKLLCNAINKLLEIQTIDMGLDVKKCLRSKTITSELVSEGTRTVEGSLTFASPGRPDGFKLNCELAYFGTPEIANIVGGLEGGIKCN